MAAPYKEDKFDVELGALEAKSSNDAPEGMGRLLYEIDADTVDAFDKLFCKFGRHRAQFFEHVVVIRQTARWCCFPKSYATVVVPRFKLVNASVSRSVPSNAILMAVLLSLGVILCVIGGTTSLPIYYLFGALSLACFLYLIMRPFCFKEHYVHLEVKDSAGRGGLFGGASFRTKLYSICSGNKKPNEAFIIEYVYGSLHTLSEPVHTLAHLTTADLAMPYTPIGLADTQALETFSNLLPRAFTTPNMRNKTRPSNLRGNHGTMVRQVAPAPSLQAGGFPAQNNDAQQSLPPSKSTVRNSSNHEVLSGAVDLSMNGAPRARTGAQTSEAAEGTSTGIVRTKQTEVANPDGSTTITTVHPDGSRTVTTTSVRNRGNSSQGQLRRSQQVEGRSRKNRHATGSPPQSQIDV